MKLTTEGKVFSPLWTRDGKSLVYESNNASSLRMIAAEAGASSRPAAPDLHLHPYGWSTDGKELIGVRIGNSETDSDIVRLLPDPSATVMDVVKTKAREGLAGTSVSLDGRWLAYTSDTTGALELWVQPLSGPGSPVRISPRGGVEPVWARNGRELFYLEGTKMMSVTIDAGQAFNFKPPVVLFDYEDPAHSASHVRCRSRWTFPCPQVLGDRTSTDRHLGDHQLGAERRQSPVTNVL